MEKRKTVSFWGGIVTPEQNGTNALKGRGPLRGKKKADKDDY